MHRDLVVFLLNGFVFSALRSDFLVHKVQHGSMIELVREMSLLVAVRAKRDFSVLLKEATSEKNKLFLDSVDELFSFAEVCDLHYGYALQDVSLDHAVALALLPASGTVVTDYWLALERKAVEACETDSEVLAELQVRKAKKKTSFVLIVSCGVRFVLVVVLPCFLWRSNEKAILEMFMVRLCPTW